MEKHTEKKHDHASSQAYTDACLEDYVSLVDLWYILKQQWKMICAITGLSLLGAVVYVLVATPVYEAEALVKSPERKYVEVMNIPGISAISSSDIFAMFIGNLKSNSLHEQFVEKNPQFSPLRESVVNIKVGEKNESGFVFVSIQGYDSKLAADWVNGFVQLVEKKTIDDFLGGVETKIFNQKKEIESQLEIARDFAGQRRLDRIALLENQIAIARASKIFDRQVSGYSVIEGQRFGESLDILQGPMYLRGVKELAAEKEVLEKRKNDEPFIAGFREKQESLAQLDAGLKQLQAARATARAVTIDQLAIQPKIPVKPRRMRVLVLSIVFGGVIGVFVVFMINFIEQQRKQREVSTVSAVLISQ